MLSIAMQRKGTRAQNLRELISDKINYGLLYSLWIILCTKYINKIIIKNNNEWCTTVHHVQCPISIRYTIHTTLYVYTVAVAI